MPPPSDKASRILASYLRRGLLQRHVARCRPHQSDRSAFGCGYPVFTHGHRNKRALRLRYQRLPSPGHQRPHRCCPACTAVAIAFRILPRARWLVATTATDGMPGGFNRGKPWRVEDGVVAASWQCNCRFDGCGLKSLALLLMHQRSVWQHGRRPRHCRSHRSASSCWTGLQSCCMDRPNPIARGS